MKYYFQLQYTMLNRQLRGFGVHPLVGYLSGMAVFLAISLLLFQRLSTAPVIYTGIGVFLIAKLSDKNRNQFLRSCFLSVRYRQLRIIENTIAAIPFLLFLIVNTSFGFAIVLLASGVLLSFIQIGNAQLFALPTPFYKHPFEYPAGFRKNGWLVLLCFGLTIIAIAVDNFNLGAFALIIVFLVTYSFYNAVEETFYVWIFSKRPKALLLKKIQVALIYAVFLWLPITVALMLFYPNHMVAVLGIVILGCLNLISFVLLKYTSFPENPHLPQLLLSGAGLLFPPLLLLTIIFFYRQASEKLNKILS